MPKQPTDQRKQRRDLVASDQFGRKWGLTIEISTGDPTGQIFTAGWEDPLRTPQRYLRVPRENGQPQWGRLLVDFDLWTSHQEQAERDWKRQLWQIGQQQYKNAFRPNEAEADEFLCMLCGPKPWPSSDVLKLAKAGDEALLGMKPLTKRERTMLHILTDEDMAGESVKVTTYQQFVTEQRALGKTMKDIGAMWSERKQALAGV